MISSYDEFIPALKEYGFMLFLGRTPLLKLSDLTDERGWFTGEEGSDPWEWKRMLVERRDGAYAKIRAGQNMLIAPEWHKMFIAAFSSRESLEERYESGEISAELFRLHRLFEERPVWSRHELTRETGFKKSALEKALNGLQQEMAITVSGEVQRVTDKFSPVGWRSMEYTRIDVWTPEACEEAAQMDRYEAQALILEQAMKNAPGASETAVRRFFRL